MNYLNALKKQSAYVDQGITKLVEELNTISNSTECDTTSLQQYCDKIESLREELKALIETTRMNMLQEKKLQKKRKAVITAVSEYVCEIENNFGISITIPDQERVPNESGQDSSLQFNNSKNKSADFDHSCDNEDIDALLSRSLPKLLPL